MTKSPTGPFRRKQLIVGLDACEWTLVRRWIDEGKMLVLAEMLEAGTHGTLRTTAEQLPDTVWSCIYGGRGPATCATCTTTASPGSRSGWC